MSIHAMSSKKASQVKRKGHQREVDFNARLGYVQADVNWSGSSADCQFNESRLPQDLREWVGEDINGGVSLKGGNTIQSHLGNLPELTVSDYVVSETSYGCTKVDHGYTLQEQVDTLRDTQFWDKYLRKGDVICYDDDNGEYSFFKTGDVIDYICNETEWRLLDTGRLKGDIKGKQYLTYEYRKKKNMFVMGAHGGAKGKEFIQHLKQNIDCFIFNYNKKIKRSNDQIRNYLENKKLGDKFV